MSDRLILSLCFTFILGCAAAVAFMIYENGRMG